MYDPAPAAANRPPAASPGSREAYPSSWSCYPVKQALASSTPGRLRLDTLDDRSWYRDALAKPPTLSKKRHGPIAESVKRWRGVSAKQAARNFYFFAPPALTAIFHTVPASRRIAVTHALQLWRGDVDLENAAPHIIPIVSLLAHRDPADILPDAKSARKLTGHWGGLNRLRGAPAVLAWLETVPRQERTAAVAQVDALLARHPGLSQCNGLFRALARVEAKDLPALFTQFHTMFTYYDWQASPTHVLLIDALSRVHRLQRSALAKQTMHAMSVVGIGHPVSIPTLLSEVPFHEREALAGGLKEFFEALALTPGFSQTEYLSCLKTLPASKRILFLQSLAGAWKAARDPAYRPNDVALAALWLFYGHIDHRRLPDTNMQIYLTRAVQALVSLDDPTQEAMNVVGLSKKLACGSVHTLDMLPSMAQTLCEVPSAHRERFAALARALCEGVPGDEDRIRTTQLLANFAPDAWSTMVEACTPLREAGLYPALEFEGVQTVLRHATVDSASDICAEFLEGGLAKAARRQRDERGPDPDRPLMRRPDPRGFIVDS